MPLPRPRKRLELATNPAYHKCRQRVLAFLYEFEHARDSGLTAARAQRHETTMSGDFTPEQKRYLEGFISGLQIARGRVGACRLRPRRGQADGPDAAHLAAQDRTVAAGGKLNDQEKCKREQHPFDAYPRLTAQAETQRVSQAAPTTSAGATTDCSTSRRRRIRYMCRLRIPNGILKHWQFAGLADLAERYGGGYAHVTTRANLQIREIEAEERGRRDRGDPGPRAVLARLGRRQHPQRHRHADRRHRPAGTDRHAALCARMAPSTSSTIARSTACRASSTSPSTAAA